MPTVPSTHDFADGIATSSEANSYIRDPLAFLLGPPVCKVRQTVLQSIPNSVWTALTFDVEEYDQALGAPAAQHDTVSNNSRFVAAYSGLYRPSGSYGVAANATGRRGTRWHVNGTAQNGTTILVPATLASTLAIPATTNLIYLNVGDYLELFVLQESGGALNTVVTADQQSHMSVVFESN